MNARKTPGTVLAATLLSISGICAHAQQPGGGFNTPTPGGNIMPGANPGFMPTPGNSAFGNLGSGFYFGFNPAMGYGLLGTGYSSYGGYGYSDPSIAITPFGIQSVGYGYNGFTGTGAGYNPSWEILNSAYSQGYQDAMGTADPGASSSPNGETGATGMTATPRNSNAARVPHGNDSVRMWKVGRGEIALRWQGDSRTASSVTFALVDRSGQVLRQTTVDQLPAEVRFTPGQKAVYYQVKVRYVDGAVNTIMGRLSPR